MLIIQHSDCFWWLTSFLSKKLGSRAFSLSICQRRTYQRSSALGVIWSFSPGIPLTPGKCAEGCQQSSGDVFTFLKVRKLNGVVPIPQKLFPWGSFLGGDWEGQWHSTKKLDKLPQALNSKGPCIQAKNKEKIWETLQHEELIWEEISSLYILNNYLTNNKDTCSARLSTMLGHKNTKVKKRYTWSLLMEIIPSQVGHTLNQLLKYMVNDNS